MSETLHVDHVIYSGNGLVHKPDGTTVLVPFTLPGETIETNETNETNDSNVSNEVPLLCVLIPSPERVAAPCPHFETCGGCHYQMATYAEQLRLKRSILEETLQRVGVDAIPEISTHSAEPWGYRNRIRLRIARAGHPQPTGDTGDTALRIGYNRHGTTEFLPISTCLIAAPVLWSTAESLLAAATQSRDADYWLNAAAEVELFCDHTLTRVQITLFCAPRTKAHSGSFDRLAAALQAHAPQGITIAATAAVAFDPRTGPTGRMLAAAGAPGLNYRVLDETYWITRGGFFQTNRFLLETLVKLVCYEDGQQRSGALAWDLYAGVGLFSRVLARSFTRSTAVEANPAAAADLRAALAAQQKGNAQQKAKKLSLGGTALAATTLDFLRAAVLERDRPELIVLDPPRAGAGLEACDLLLRIAAPTLVYVSCDPTTLARDLQALQPLYQITALHLVDLFPQTFHIETIVVLERRA
jgi:23S rRNA (uracil1939-C5)-methyltransferase